MVCNSGLRPQDVATTRAAASALRQEWCGFKPEALIDTVGDLAKQRFARLHRLLASRKLQVRVLPDQHFGLNLQRLNTLINWDLPWNPTRLEQRKGRIQRIGQLSDTVLVYNLRYGGSVEDRVHQILSSRLQDIHTLFGQVPDVLEDVRHHSCGLSPLSAAARSISNQSSSVTRKLITLGIFVRFTVATPPL